MGFASKTEDQNERRETAVNDAKEAAKDTKEAKETKQSKSSSEKEGPSKK